MRSIYNIVRSTAAMAALGFSVFATSCSNDEPAFPTEPGEITFTAPAEIESASSRVSYTQIPGSIKVTWAPEDIVQLFPDEKNTDPIATFWVESVNNNIATFKCLEVATNATLTNVSGVFRYVPSTSGQGLVQNENGGTTHLQFANTIESDKLKGLDLINSKPTLTFHNTTAIFRVRFQLNKKMESATTIRIYGSKLWGTGAIGQTLTLNFEVNANKPIVAYIPVAGNTGSNNDFSGVLGVRVVSKDKKPIFEYARTINKTIKGGYQIGKEYTVDLINVTPYVNYDKNGHGYVNLADTNWATMNIGATDIIGDGSKGDYFKWDSKVPFNLKESSSSSTLTGNDASYENWSENWTMPTEQQFQDLISKCKWTWCDELNCYIVSSEVENSDALILLPAIGYYEGGNLMGNGELDYWTSNNTSQNAYCLRIANHAIPKAEVNYEVAMPIDDACPIRPVFKSTTVQ